MSRYTSSGSTDHNYTRYGPNDYEISWVVDYYYEGSRLRYPRRFTRWTDEIGVRRFCKKWDLKFEEETPQ